MVVCGKWVGGMTCYAWTVVLWGFWQEEVRRPQIVVVLLDVWVVMMVLGVLGW